MKYNAVEPLSSGQLLNGHPYKAASNQSPNDGFSIVPTAIKRPTLFKRPQSIFPRVAV